MPNPPPVPTIPIRMALRNGLTNPFSSRVLMKGFMESLYAFFARLIKYIGHVILYSKMVALWGRVLTKYNTQSFQELDAESQ